MIARGGMATVYEAWQPALGRMVALKRLDLRGDDPLAAERFIRESRIAAAFDHPNIVTVYDFLEEDGVPYIAMEHLPRGSLRPWIGNVSVRQAFGVLEGVLAGLRHAEREGVAHRDLKPENVLVSTEGAVKIADFGIAKAYAQVSSALTATGVPVGTPAYMAPEQALGRAVDGRADLYAVGAMAFELLTGEPPFGRSAPPMALLYRQVNEPPPRLADVRRGIEPALSAWVDALLRKDPGQRPATAAAAWEALEEIAVASCGPYWRRDSALTGAPGGAADHDEPPTAVLAPRSGRPRGRSLAAAAAVLAALGAAGVLAIGSRGGGADGAGATRVRAVPYDFAGTGQRAIVAGLPEARDGGALVLSGSGTVIRGTDVAPAVSGLGAAVASGDFDADGRADLAAGAPGGDGAVVVLPGAADGVDRDGAAVLAVPGGRAAYGTAVAAGDLNGDGYADLVAGAPRAESRRDPDRGSGAIDVWFGGPDGLRPGSRRRIPRASQTAAAVGTALALGDVDGDGQVDILEAAPARGAAAGHASFCPGRPGGPVACRPMGGEGAALALGDVTGDGRLDVVQGDPGGGAGAVTLWRGTPAGPASRPVRIDQATPGVLGDPQAGDAFGAAVAVADLDRDGFADLVVGAPGEDRGAGRVTLVRGAASGAGAAEWRFYTQHSPGVPGRWRTGHAFGAALALVPGGAGGPALVVAAPGDGAGALITLPGAESGFTAAGARRVVLAEVAGGARGLRARGIRVGG